MNADYGSVLRRILFEQLRIAVANDQDNLILVDPDFPTEEVLRDAIEEFGLRCRKPVYTAWSGKFIDLVAILEANCKRLAKEAKTAGHIEESH